MEKKTKKELSKKERQCCQFVKLVSIGKDYIDEKICHNYGSKILIIL